MAERYIEAIGRRKTASARVRITPAKETTIVVNDKPIEVYFPYATLRRRIEEVLTTEGVSLGSYMITAKVVGGGISAQADAIRLGIARGLVKEDMDRRIPLKKQGLLKRDPRAVERKKPGLRKARKSPQWSKR